MRVGIHPPAVDFVIHYIRPIHLTRVVAEVQGDGVPQVEDQHIVVLRLQVDSAQLVTVGEDQIWDRRVRRLAGHTVVLQSIALVAMAAVDALAVGAILAAAPSLGAKPRVQFARIVVVQQERSRRARTEPSGRRVLASVAAVAVSGEGLGVTPTLLTVAVFVGAADTLLLAITEVFVWYTEVMVGTLPEALGARFSNYKKTKGLFHQPQRINSIFFGNFQINYLVGSWYKNQSP